VVHQIVSLDGYLKTKHHLGIKSYYTIVRVKPRMVIPISVNDHNPPSI